MVLDYPAERWALIPNEVIEENVNKLKARYPGGEFHVPLFKNRKQGDPHSQKVVDIPLIMLLLTK